MKDIARIIKKYDSELEYISGYENCYSIVKCKCNRCGNTFERKWTNLARHNTEYCCPICQDKIARKKLSMKYLNRADNLPHKTIEEREKNFINTLNMKFPTLKYLSGYKDSESEVILQCKICGKIFKRKAQCVRGNRKTTCFNCVNKESNIKKIKNKIDKYIIKLKLKYKKEKNREIKEIANKFKTNTQYIQHCNKCNKEYTEHTKSAYCPTCRKVIHHHHSNKSLKKLYERDNGICYICGNKCNWEDKRIINGTTIVGDTYPSIDHIIPLAKGGTDDWNNLGLAHVKCNTIKGIKGGVGC